MDDILKSIGAIVGGGATLGVVVFGILWMVKGSIATAIQQAGTREIERVKGEIAADLENERQSFSREVEREKRDAARDLESFKAQLTLDAEVRRQAAAKKVDVLVKFVEVINASLRGVLVIVVKSSALDDALGSQIASMNDYWSYVRGGELFLGGDALQAEVNAFGVELNRVTTEINKRSSDLLAVQREAEAARNRLLGAIRRELQLVAASAKSA